MSVILLAVAIIAAVLAPDDAAAGPSQKLLYLHLPVAMNTLLAATVMFVGCVGYLGSRSQLWDDLAHCAARVTVLNGAVLLLTGMFWARIAWGHWWTWSPRLAFSLLLWLLYVVYLGLRPMLGSSQRRAHFGAVYGVIAYLDVPLVYLSVKLLPDIHPSSVELSPGTRWVLLLWFVPVTLWTCGLIAARFQLLRQARSDRQPTRVGDGAGPRSRGIAV